LEDGIADVPAPTGVFWNTSEALSAISGATTGGVTADAIVVYGRVNPTATTSEITTTGGFNSWGNIGAGFSGVTQTSIAAAVTDIVVAETAAATSRSANVANMTADDLAFCVIAINGANTGWTPDGTTREERNTGGWSFMLVTKTGTGTVSIGGSGWANARCSIIAGRIVAAGGGGGGGGNVLAWITA
jgi:hypothetical protein